MKKFFQNKKLWGSLASIGILAAVGYFVIPQSAYAFSLDIDGLLRTGLAGIVFLIAYFLEIVLAGLGWLVSMAIEILQGVLKYNGFGDQQQVILGWQIVRDVMNTFFIAVLITIAISTIIRFQQYSYRNTLSKFVIAAILVNFSRTICLFFINASNILMMTFVNAVQDAWGAFGLGLRLPALVATSSLSIGNLYDLAANEGFVSGVSGAYLTVVSVYVTYIFAIFIMFFALAAIAFIVIVLIYRIVVLWILMILSPLAFFLYGLPGRGGSYWGQWLDEFIKYVLVGPIMAFFLYIIILFLASNTQNAYDIPLNSSSAVAGASSPFSSLFFNNAQLITGYAISLILMMIAGEVVMRLGVRGTDVAKRAFDSISAFPGNVSSYARDYLYKGAAGSRYASLAPLLKPLEGIQAIRQGLAQQQNAWVNEGRQALQDRSAIAAESLAGRTRSAYYAFGAANSEYFKDHGFLLGDKSIVKGMIGDVGDLVTRKPGTEKAKSQLAQAKMRNKARDSYGVWGEDAKKFVGMRTRDQLRNDIVRLDNYEESRTKLLDRQSKFAAGTTGYARVQRRINALDDLKKYGDELRLAHSILTDENFIPSQGGQQFDAVMTDLNKQYSEDSDRKQAVELTKLLQTRKAESQKASAGLRSELDKNINAYMKSTYNEEDRVDLDDSYNRALGNQSPASKYEYAGDLIKAAEAGLFDDVALKLNRNFTMDEGGMRAFHDHLQKDVGFTEDEAFNVIAKIVAGNRKAGKIVQSNFLKSDSSGNFKFLSKPEIDGAVAKQIASKGFMDIFRNGKRDAIAVKDSNGKYNQVSDGFIKAVKANRGAFSQFINNDKALQRSDLNAIELILKPENVKALGLTPAEVKALKDATTG